MSKYWLQRVVNTKMPYGTPERCDFCPTIVSAGCEWVRVLTEPEIQEKQLLTAKILDSAKEHRLLLEEWKQLTGREFL